jgi:CHAT domain-containing protein
MAEVPGHELIHLACHGVFGDGDSGEPLDSGLLVSDGERTLTLRACSSGRSALQTGDEPIGLTRALLYAGAGR